MTEPATTSQVTQVEQARAVAEVAAAVSVARDYPRDLNGAFAAMADACSRPDLAARAFYEVKNRGSGPTVHLARELARIFGNVQYGVHELRRDDARGESEIQAFAWDVERNTRATRTFISPHVRMKQGRRLPLVDIQDIYLNNQNVGARAVRECILSMLPADYVNEAQSIARTTLEAGGGEPLEKRVASWVEAYGKNGITQAQLEARIGRPVDKWTAQDVATLSVLWETLRRRETTVEEEFPSRVTTGEIMGGGNHPGAISDEQAEQIAGLLGELGIPDSGVSAAIKHHLGIQTNSVRTLNAGEADRFIGALQDLLADREPEAGS